MSKIGMISGPKRVLHPVGYMTPPPIELLIARERVKAEADRARLMFLLPREPEHSGVTTKLPNPPQQVKPGTRREPKSPKRYRLWSKT